MKLIFRRFIPVSMLVVLAGCMWLGTACTEQPAEDTSTDQPSLANLMEAYNETRLELNPLEATRAGDHRFNDQLPNSITPGHLESVRDYYQTTLDDLHAFDRANLSAEDQMSYDILEWECNIHLEELQFHKHLFPIDQFNGLHLSMGQFAGGTSAQPFTTPQEYDDWLVRLDSFLDFLNSTQENMQQGMAEGYTLPKPLAAKMVPQFSALDHGPVEEHLYYSPINQFPESFSEEDKTRLTTAYSTFIEDKLMPRFGEMAEFLEKEYMPNCRTTTGIAGIPDGEAYYKNRIKLYTTTEMTSDEIFALGESEVERISAEMEKVKAEVGFEGDLKAFFDHVRSNPDLMPYTDPQQAVDHFNEIHEKMKPNLANLFDLTPKTAFEVRRTEAFREASASAEYNPGSLDGTRPGIFYVPVPDVKAYNLYSDEDLFLHEAIPGHHYQCSLQQENEDLPIFRRQLWYSAYGEGWALYSESLGKELGLYEDPYQYFGMLSAEMHRAIRLVVDVGMHAKGWTREEAIQYSLDHEAESEASITAEIERYMAFPGQALSYKIGQLKIRELRARAESEMGESFDIKAFHNIMLESGCVPLKILEEKTDRWIAGAAS